MALNAKGWPSITFNLLQAKVKLFPGEILGVREARAGGRFSRQNEAVLLPLDTAGEGQIFAGVGNF